MCVCASMRVCVWLFFATLLFRANKLSMHHWHDNHRSKNVQSEAIAKCGLQLLWKWRHCKVKVCSPAGLKVKVLQSAGLEQCWKWRCCKVQVWSSVESEGVAKCRFAAVLKLKMLQSAGLQLYWPFIYQLSTGILLSTSSIQTPLHKLHTHTTHTQICWIPSVSHFIHYR